MSISRASTACSTVSSQSIRTNNAILIQKISADYHNLKDAQEKMEQQNEDLQHELAKLRKHEIADRLVIDETVKSATSDEIADNYCKKFRISSSRKEWLYYMIIFF